MDTAAVQRPGTTRMKREDFTERVIVVPLKVHSAQGVQTLRTPANGSGR